jgi:hypothetical protein
MQRSPDGKGNPVWRIILISFSVMVGFGITQTLFGKSIPTLYLHALVLITIVALGQIVFELAAIPHQMINVILYVGVYVFGMISDGAGKIRDLLNFLIRK